MTTQTIIRRERHQRGAFGKLIKWTFIGFNAFMLLWLVTGMAAVSNMQVSNGAERAGQAIGATLGASMIMSLWFFGAMILGLFVLFTRGEKVIIEETSGASSNNWGSPMAVDAQPMNADAMIQRYAAANNVRLAPNAQAAPIGSQPAGFGKRRATP